MVFVFSFFCNGNWESVGKICQKAAVLFHSNGIWFENRVNLLNFRIIFPKYLLLFVILSVSRKLISVPRIKMDQIIVLQLFLREELNDDFWAVLRIPPYLDLESMYSISYRHFGHNL